MRPSDPPPPRCSHSAKPACSVGSTVTPTPSATGRCNERQRSHLVEHGVIRPGDPWRQGHLRPCRAVRTEPHVSDGSRPKAISSTAQINALWRSHRHQALACAPRSIRQLHPGRFLQCESAFLSVDRAVCGESLQRRRQVVAGWRCDRNGGDQRSCATEREKDGNHRASVRRDFGNDQFADILIFKPDRHVPEPKTHTWRCHV